VNPHSSLRPPRAPAAPPPTTAARRCPNAPHLKQPPPAPPRTLSLTRMHRYARAPITGYPLVRVALGCVSSVQPPYSGPALRRRPLGPHYRRPHPDNACGSRAAPIGAPDSKQFGRPQGVRSASPSRARAADMRSAARAALSAARRLPPPARASHARTRALRERADAVLPSPRALTRGTCSGWGCWRRAPSTRERSSPRCVS